MKDFTRLECIYLFLISGYLLLQLINGAKLVVHPAGELHRQPLGKGFGLTCQGEAEGGDDDNFSEMKWIGPKGELKSGNTDPEVNQIDRTRLVLMFKTPTSQDTGMYNCTAVYGNIDQLNTHVKLEFYQDITWDDCPTQQALVINSNGKVRCRVSANPPASISWARNDQSLDDPRYDTQTDGIQVTDVTGIDAGIFTVRAMVSQTGKFQIRNIKVEVHVPPAIESIEGEKQPIEGTETMIRCQASGFPQPLYSWFDKNQRNLSNIEGYTVNPDLGTITISSVKREDDGTYTCLAKNPAGEKRGTFDLSVIVKPEIREFNNITAVEGKRATLECHAYGDPPPEMTIRKDGLESPFHNSEDRHTINKRAEGDKAIITLTIDDVVRSDDGLYYCAAENKGAHVEKVGHLTVEFAPVMSSTPSISVKTWNGNPVNLTCIAESIPNASISWFYLGKELRNDDLYFIHTHAAHSNLLVRPPSKSGRDVPTVYGTYKCVARNPHGEQFINIELQEARPPSVLYETEVEKLTATTIVFKFRGPNDNGGLPVRAYLVKYYEENAPFTEPEVFEFSEGAPPYILEKLKPRTAYKFQFAAKNNAGIGEWSSEQRIVMPSEAAPESPRFITPGGNTSTYPDRFQVRWTIPLDNGRKIDYFELRYFETEKRNGEWKRLGNANVEEKRITDWENAPMYEMRNLKANTNYKVEVRAHNSIGYSIVSTMVFQTAAGIESTSGYPRSGGGLTAGAIVAIIIVLVLVILIVLDVTCYIRYQWGVLFLLRNRVCPKPIGDNKVKEAAVEDGKGGKGDSGEKKNKTEVDNPAFDKEKELLKAKEAAAENESEVATEETPMIQYSGAKDSKLIDNSDEKNKSPKGSKSSIAKDSLV